LVTIPGPKPYLSMETYKDLAEPTRTKLLVVIALFNLLEGTVFDNKVMVMPSYNASEYGMPFHSSSFGFELTKRLMYLQRHEGRIWATFNASGSQPVENLRSQDLHDLGIYLEKQAGLVSNNS